MKWLVLVASLLLASCGGQSTLTTNSPPSTAHASPSAVTTTQATPQVAGILIDLGSGNAPNYGLTVVRADGTVLATVHPKKRAAILASGISAPAAIELPYVSPSATRVYYLDGDETIKFLALDGSTGTVATVPGTTRAHVAFAVSPDDQRMAVSVLDYATTPPTVHLYVEDLGGANQHEIFSSSSSYVWPIGWHARQLVLAVGSIYSQQGVAWNPYDGAAYHVVDATTANRTATIGSGMSSDGCQPTGPLSSAGTACFVLTPCQGCLGQTLIALGWNGQQLAAGSIQVGGQRMGALSPEGQLADCCDGSGHVIFHRTGAPPTVLSGAPSDWVCWLDATHLLSGFTISSEQIQPAILDLDSGRVTPVTAKGFCAGTLPGIS